MGARLGEISCPTFVRTGELDVATPVHHARQLGAGIAGAEVSIPAGRGHAQWVEDAEGLVAEVGVFLGAC